MLASQVPLAEAPAVGAGSGSQVADFYTNKNVLITGATGFLGKVILWKLLDSCPGVGKIYVLLRSKANTSASKRLISLLKNKPFSDKYDYARLLNTVVAIEADLTAPQMGLSQTDRSLLEESVNVVLHSAASVKFDAPLKDNMRDNVLGTRSIIELCQRIHRLNAFVHVSTAYSNCQLRDIGEQLEPLERDIDAVLQTVDSYAGEVPARVADDLLEGRPNTYTYTKAIAEHYVARLEGKFPIAIVRPSIVISSAAEPSPGWVDNVNGIAGLGCLAAIGVLRTIDWNYYATSDMVPVDFVTNCILAAGQQASQNSPNKLRIYNMTSGNMKPISWGGFFDMLRQQAAEKPSSKIVRPMIQAPRYKRANPISFILTRFFSELLFAYAIDTLLTLIGYKKIMVKITTKMHHGYKILLPFTTGEWKFDSTNVCAMFDSMSTIDKSRFNFDMRDFDWAVQARHVWLGARTHLLREAPTEEAYKQGQTRQRIVTILHYGLVGLFWAGVSTLSYSSARLMGAF